MRNYISWAEKGYLPDFLIRFGISQLQKKRIVWSAEQSVSANEEHHQSWVDKMRNSSIAYVPDKANEQHYEVPPEFFEYVLGTNLKYSSGYWPKGIVSLDDSELAMLKLSAERAELYDGQSILELGCGWGSFTLFMAEKFPSSKITAVSNSKDQRKFIENKCEIKGLSNVNVITADMNDFSIEESFDRVVSIEMFEHMRNYELLLERISTWMKPKAKLFIHILRSVCAVC